MNLWLVKLHSTKWWAINDPSVAHKWQVMGLGAQVEIEYLYGTGVLKLHWWKDFGLKSAAFCSSKFAGFRFQAVLSSRYGTPEVFRCPFCLEPGWSIGSRRLCFRWDLRRRWWLCPGVDGGRRWWEHLFDWGISLGCRLSHWPVGSCQTLREWLHQGICVEEVGLPDRYCILLGTYSPQRLQGKRWVSNSAVQHHFGEPTRGSQIAERGDAELHGHCWVLRTHQWKQDGVAGGNQQAKQLAPVPASPASLQHRFGQCHHRNGYHHAVPRGNHRGKHGDGHRERQHHGKQRWKQRRRCRQHLGSPDGGGCHGIAGAKTGDMIWLHFFGTKGTCRTT